MTSVIKNRNWEVFPLIYISHCLSAWGDRMWDFAVGLYMVILYPDSLLLTAILGFSIAFAVITLGSPLGSWIDTTKRIRSATVAIIIQNTAVALGAAALALTFNFKDDIQGMWNGSLEILIYAFIIGTSIIAKLASVASDIAIERDWIVVLTDGDTAKLATMNSVMRTIDLTTKILAPAAIGALISYWSQLSGAIFIACWNILSGFVEVYLLILIYRRTPELGNKYFQFQSTASGAEASSSKEAKSNSKFKECWGGWRQYLRHPVKWAGIGISCLYMTVLGFDQITIGYMYSQGVAESYAGFLMGAGAITGILGSVSYPFLRKWIGGNATTFLGYILNSVCLLLCVVSVFMQGSPFEPGALWSPFGNSSSTPAEDHQTLSLAELWELRQNIFYFAAGIVFARFGLWVADLSIAQLFQDSVEESKRGVINGVQNSMQQALDLFKFLLVILLPTPQTFGYLIIATWIFSCAAVGLHSVYSSEYGNRHAPGPRERRLGRTSSSGESSNEETPLLSQR